MPEYARCFPAGRIRLSPDCVAASSHEDKVCFTASRSMCFLPRLISNTMVCRFRRTDGQSQCLRYSRWAPPDQKNQQLLRNDGIAGQQAGSRLQ